jgi:hypothetical protein
MWPMGTCGLEALLLFHVLPINFPYAYHVHLKFNSSKLQNAHIMRFQYYTIPYRIHVDSSGFQWILMDYNGLHYTTGLSPILNTKLDSTGLSDILNRKLDSTGLSTMFNTKPDLLNTLELICQ